MVKVVSLLLLPLKNAHYANYWPLASICRKVLPHFSNLAAFATYNNDTDSRIYLRGDADYSIRQVSSKARALDVKVFRGFSVSAHEHILDQQRNNRRVLSEMQAIDFLMKNYDDYGNYIMHDRQESYEPETYFAAMYRGEEPEKMEYFSRQNGIIGVVSAQLRRRAPLEYALTSTHILSPHVYVANMRVHEEMRRQGVGKALLSSVLAYTITLSERVDETIPLLLSVENENLGAIQLYRQLGFEYVEKNKVFGLMLLVPTTP